MQNNFNPENIKILGWKLLLEQINSPLDFDTALISWHGFHVDMNLDIDPDDDILKADLRIEVITESEGDNMEEAQAVFHILYFIRVEDISEFTISREAEKIVLHNDLGNYIAAITYSTSRGILLSRVVGTALKDFILPLIDTDSLISGTLNDNA